MKRTARSSIISILLLFAMLLGVFTVGVFTVGAESASDVSVTVTGATAYLDDKHLDVYTGAEKLGDNLYLVADKAEEGQVFLRWDIVKDGAHTYPTEKEITCSVNDAEEISITAIYRKDIGQIKLEVPEPSIGGVVDYSAVRKVGENAEHYEIIRTYYYYREGDRSIRLNDGDAFVEGVGYSFSYELRLEEGYWFPGEYIQLNEYSSRLHIMRHEDGTAVGEKILNSLVYIGIEVVGGTLYRDGVETTETKFLPGTRLTVVADSNREDGKVLRYWSISNSGYVEHNDIRSPELSFTLKQSTVKDMVITIEGNYITPSDREFFKFCIDTPAAGETPSYDVDGVGDVRYREHKSELLGWYENGELLSDTHVFEFGKTYTARMKFTAESGFYIGEHRGYNLYPNFNGKTETMSRVPCVERADDGSYIIIDVPVTAIYREKSAAVSVTPPVVVTKPSYELDKGEGLHVGASVTAWEVRNEAGTWVALEEGERFFAGNTYRVRVTFERTEEYFMDESDFSVTINGQKASVCGDARSFCYCVEYTLKKGEEVAVTVNNGTANVRDTAVESVTAGTLVTLVASEIEGKVFDHWEVNAGENVILADATAKETTFYMPACDVEITAVYEDIVYFSELHVTTKAPVPGEYFDGLSSANPEKYTVVLQKITVQSGYSKEQEFDPSNPYESGCYYYYYFTIELTETAATDEKTKVLLNGKYVELEYVDKQYTGVYFQKIRAPFIITVENGVADASGYGDSNITYANKSEYFYVVANPAPEGYAFSHWEIIGSPGWYGDKTSDRMRVRQDEEPLTFIAHYQKLYSITVVGGYASRETSIPGRSIRLWANQAPEDGTLSHWLLDGVRIELDASSSFTMPERDVVLEAIYHVHTFDDTLTFGQSSHWHQCTDPDCVNPNNGMKDIVRHTYDHACDTTCNGGCGYVRTITHDFTTGEWLSDAEQHWHICAVEGCGVLEEKKGHEFEGGVCVICQHVCTHRGGTATCKTQASCELCSELYGELDPATHAEASVWHAAAYTHEKIFDCCGVVDVAAQAHTFSSGICTVCGLPRSNVLGSFAVNGMPVPYHSQTVSNYLAAVEEALEKGFVTVNGVAFDVETRTFGSLRFQDVVILDAEGNPMTSGTLPDGKYHICLGFTTVEGYYFVSEGNATGTFDGKEAEYAIPVGEVMYVCSPVFEVVPELIDRIDVKGTVPVLGMSLGEFYELAEKNINVNGAFDESDYAIFGAFNMIEGGLTNQYKHLLDDFDAKIGEGTYYFYFYFKLSSSKYEFADEVTVTFEGTEDVSVRFVTRGVELYAKYVLRHTCVDEELVDHKCDICGAYGITPHQGGTATCKTQAQCEICSEYYGELDATHHENAPIWNITAYTHKKSFDCCGVVEISEGDHSYSADVCTVCGFERSHIISSFTVSGVFAPYNSQTASDYIAAVEEALAAGLIKVNGLAFDVDTKTFGGLKLQNISVIDAASSLVVSGAIQNGNYHVCFGFAVTEGYYFAQEDNMTGTFDGEDAEYVLSFGEEMYVCSPAFEVAPEMIDSIVIMGTVPTLGMTLEEYYEQAKGITVNGALDLESNGIYGMFEMWEGGLTDSLKGLLYGPGIVLHEATYYFHFFFKLTSGRYEFADRVNVTFEGTDDVSVRFASGGIDLYAKYVLRHTCVDVSPLNHRCDYCGTDGITPHQGGTATCKRQAVCEICSAQYGELDATRHEESAVWHVTAYTHEKIFDCCGAVDVSEGAHSYSAGVCTVCGFERSRIISNITVSGLFAPYNSQSVLGYIAAVEEALEKGLIKVNGTALDMTTGLFGNLKLQDITVLDDTGAPKTSGRMQNGTYYVCFVFTTVEGYYFPREEDVAASFDGEDAEYTIPVGTDLYVCSPAFAVAPEVIDKIVITGAAPSLGMTVKDYYEYAGGIAVNGALDSMSNGTYGILVMTDGGLTDQNKQLIAISNEKIVDGTYYFYACFDLSSARYAFADTVTITFDGTTEVEVTRSSGGIVLYAKYVLQHTCEDVAPVDHNCDVCGEAISTCVDAAPKDHVCDICGATGMGTHAAGEGKHTCDYCGEAASTCVDAAPKDHVCDVCGATGVGTHAAGAGKHTCDYCGVAVSICSDHTPKDHVCDICGAMGMGTHAAGAGKHTCDYCGAAVSTCSDTAPKDHVCDVCGATGMGTHAAAEGKHTCDYCGATVSTCEGSEMNNDICHTCGDEIESDADGKKDTAFVVVLVVSIAAVVLMGFGLVFSSTKIRNKAKRRRR